jgi:hypothetical protein
MGWTAGVQFPAEATTGISLFLTASRQALGPTQPPTHWIPEAPTPGVKLTTHPPSAEVKNAWSYTSTPPVCLHGVVVKNSDNFTFELHVKYELCLTNIN